MTVVQSVIFKREFGISNARAWLTKNGFGSNKVDITPESLRFRQYDPKPLEAMGYRFRTKKFAHGSFVIAFPSGRK